MNEKRKIIYKNIEINETKNDLVSICNDTLNGVSMLNTQYREYNTIVYNNNNKISLTHHISNNKIVKTSTITYDGCDLNILLVLFDYLLNTVLNNDKLECRTVKLNESCCIFYDEIVKFLNKCGFFEGYSDIYGIEFSKDN